VIVAARRRSSLVSNRLVSSTSVAAAVAAVLAGLAAACQSHDAAVPMRAPATFAEQTAHGQAVYAQHCAKCHGDNGEGDEGPRVVGLAQGALPLDPPPDRKVRRTRFVTVGDVADFVVANMPPKKAGTT
jgi:cytochrome c